MDRNEQIWSPTAMMTSIVIRFNLAIEMLLMDRNTKHDYQGGNTVKDEADTQ